jgi:hypothetical protein
MIALDLVQFRDEVSRSVMTSKPVRPRAPHSGRVLVSRVASLGPPQVTSRLAYPLLMAGCYQACRAFELYTKRWFWAGPEE